MTKINSLLKKVELFEKLTTYGDRGAFLKSIAKTNLPTNTDKEPTNVSLKLAEFAKEVYKLGREYNNKKLMLAANTIIKNYTPN